MLWETQTHPLKKTQYSWLNIEPIAWILLIINGVVSDFSHFFDVLLSRRSISLLVKERQKQNLWIEHIQRDKNRVLLLSDWNYLQLKSTNWQYHSLLFGNNYRVKTVNNVIYVCIIVNLVLHYCTTVLICDRWKKTYHLHCLDPARQQGDCWFFCPQYNNNKKRLEDDNNGNNKEPMYDEIPSTKKQGVPNLGGWRRE